MNVSLKSTSPTPPLQKAAPKRTGARTPLQILLALVLAISLVGFTGCSNAASQGDQTSSSAQTSVESAANAPDGSYLPFDISQAPDYTGEPYLIINDNMPAFSEEELSVDPGHEHYADLDSLGRCGSALALVGIETAPTEKRGDIGSVKPSGWQTTRYDDLIDGKYLYNRCHLIGYQLTAENANEKNLITGTRYLNTEGMLPFENEVDDYIEATNNHVLYRATPVFVGDELVARGVQLEAFSIEDGGASVSFNVFCYNVQPGIEINYATGESWRSGEQAPTKTDTTAETTYILNTNSKKFHLSSCSSVSQIKSANKRGFTGTRDEIISQGYEPCSKCHP